MTSKNIIPHSGGNLPNLAAGSVCPDPAPLPSTASDQGTHSFQELYDASLIGVQSGFPHLEIDDIALPPHGWNDAKLARQIADHILMTRFEITRAQLVSELERSRDALKRSMANIDERMDSERFADRVEAMADVAETNRRDDQS